MTETKPNNSFQSQPPVDKYSSEDKSWIDEAAVMFARLFYQQYLDSRKRKRKNSSRGYADSLDG